MEHYVRALNILEEVGEPSDTASTLGQLGILEHNRGNYDKALEYFQRALKIDKEINSRSGMARAFHNIGLVQQARRDYEQALDYYDRSLRIDEELGNRSGVASSHGQIGKLLGELGRYEEAFRNVLSAFAIFLELHSPDVHIAINDLRTIRVAWDKEKFDAAWKEATGTDVPDWLIE